jgi:hypothetical protein
MANLESKCGYAQDRGEKVWERACSGRLGRQSDARLRRSNDDDVR